MSKFNQTCWEIFTLSSSLCGKIFRSIQVLLIFWKPIEVHRFNWVHQTTFEGCNFGGLYLLHPMLFWIKFVGLCFPFSLVTVVKFSCQSKLFWMFGRNSKFKIPTFLDYNELWWLVSSSYIVYFQWIFLEKLHILV